VRTEKRVDDEVEIYLKMRRNEEMERGRKEEKFPKCRDGE